MTTSQSAFHTCPMAELLRVALRVIGVVLPGAALWGFVAVTRGVSSDDADETFIWALWISWLTAAVWAAIDSSRAPGSRVLVRWVAIAVVVGGGLGIVITAFGPGPSQWTSDMVYLLFWCVPLLAAAGLGVVIGMAVAAISNRARRRHEATSGTRSGH